MKWNIFLLSCFIYCTSCKENETPDVIPTVDNDSVTYFQLKQFINEEVQNVNQTPYYIYKRLIVDNKPIDSVTISKEDFNTLAAIFAEADINDPKVKRYYSESVFEDASTNSFVLTYKSIDPKKAVQTIDVMLDNETQKVKRIDIKKLFDRNDTSYTEHLVWKGGQSYEIIRTGSKNTYQSTQQTQVVWNNKNIRNDE